jgi:hypothetical protein
MPKWNKDAKEFEVSIHYDNVKGSQIRIPKPILEKMDNPDKVTFVVNGKNVTVIPSKKSGITKPTKIKIKHIKKEDN